ncbi:hypothetical protein VKT23_015319 [Stygiomarasmius scandens]|uniref:Uncharacterized protein n=1 Tax=Marasmiellus scandens TaxID=2682957 RepID=A0ABR1J193_9AGAR
MFNTCYDVLHLLPFADEISLTEPLQSPIEAHDWFQFTDPHEAGLLMLVAETDGSVFDAPRCRTDTKLWHRAEISLDVDNKLGSLFRVDEEEHNCNCPRILFCPDQYHRRCIRRAWIFLKDRFDAVKDVQGPKQQERLLQGPPLMPSTSIRKVAARVGNYPETSQTLKKRPRDEIGNEGERVIKKARRSSLGVHETLPRVSKRARRCKT